MSTIYIPESIWLIRVGGSFASFACAIEEVNEVSAAISSQISALKKWLTDVTSPLADRVAQTPTTVGQAQTLAGAALEQTAALKSETEQMRTAMEITLKEQLPATSKMTRARMNEIADVMTWKMMEMQAQT